MIIVADSGSTRTGWCLLGGGQVVAERESPGLNPLHMDERQFLAVLDQAGVAGWADQPVRQVYFYGAGLGQAGQREQVAGWLKKTFPGAAIAAASDLLGAARALLGRQAGIAGILGTGSNSGYYDGEQLIQQVPPLGYLLGDEGSGYALGRRLVQAFLRQQLPADLQRAFYGFYPEYRQLPEKIYRAPSPARELAALAPFLHRHRQHPVVRDMLLQEFDRYFTLLASYPADLPVALVGSIAYHFAGEVRQAAAGRDRQVGTILPDPLPGLVRYHAATAGGSRQAGTDL